MSSDPRTRRSYSLRKIFLAPLVIALLSLVGLATALTGDGLRDALSWLCLALPIAALAWAVRARRL